MKYNSLKEFFEDIHNNAIDHGFWDGEMKADAILAKIALCHGELSEALEEVRKGGSCYNVYLNDEKPEGLVVELADVVIRIIDLCEGLGLDLETAMMVKHKYNKGREWKHGKEI